ncbi:MAG: DinB family protein [Bacillota bacterium]
MPAWEAGPETLALLRELFAWDGKVRQIIFDAVRGLTAEQLSRPVGFGKGSLLGILLHVYSAQLNWVTRRIWGQARQEVDTADLADPARLRAAWDDLDRTTERTLAELTPQQLNEVVEAPRTEPGTPPWRATRAQMLLHAGTHAIYHRSQIRRALKELGRELPELDYIFFA